MTSALFSPIKLADLELSNRIVIAPMCQYSADDGVPSPWHTTHLGMLANSGASLVIVEASGVERVGRITHGCTGIYSDASEDAFRTIIRDRDLLLTYVSSILGGGARGLGVLNVFVPLYVNGRRWGNFELAYRDEAMRL